MAIEKNSFKGSRFDHEFSPNSKDTTSSDDEEIQRRVSADESDDDDDDEFNDADSGAGSDDFDLLELGETGAEFCQIGDLTCSIPFELYDLSGLEDILSVDVWNEVLSEDERFSLTKYLPDLDQDTFMRTVKELLEGQNFHFGSPVKKLFEMLKGGLCDPRVTLYREGLMFFQKRQHYHFLRKHQNAMVSNLCQIRDAWFNCRGYSIEEKLRVLNIMKSENRLMYENMDVGLASDSSEEFGDRQWAKKAKNYGKQNQKGMLRLAGMKTGLSNEMSGRFPSVYQGMDLNSRPYGLPIPTSREKLMGYESRPALRLRDEMRMDDGDDSTFSGFPFALNSDARVYGRTKTANRVTEIKSGKVSNGRSSKEFSKKAKYLENNEPVWHSSNQGPEFLLDPTWKSDDWSMKRKKWKPGSEPLDLNQTDRILLSELRQRPSREKIGGSFRAPDNRTKKTNKMYARNEETESDSSDEFDEEEDNNLLVRSKFAHPTVKSGPLSKKGKFVKEGTRDSPLGSYSELGQSPVYPSKSKKKGKSGQLLESGVLYPYNLKQKGESRLDYDIDEEDKSLLADENATSRLGKIKRGSDRFDGFSSVAKKRRAKEDINGRDEDVILPSNGRFQMDEPVSLKKKGKRKVELGTGTSEVELNELPVSEIGAAEMDVEAKPQKKPYTPITPTVHTSFSFSIVHLLSAVRLAMTSPLPEDSLEVRKPDEHQNENHDSNGVAEAGKADEVIQVNNGAPSLTVQEIVNRVRSNPGDPCILETQEPLQDLVRGVLKIFASKTAPLGAKGWKALVAFQKPSKSWSWIGPMSQSSTDGDSTEVTSPEYWGLPHKMLVKLVDSFANWLKSGQETLQRIGILPEPPASLMQANLDEKERFRDLRAQKSLNTINPSSEEVRDYFRKEEILRYSFPDRAFSYTAADGKKSIVAPLRRFSGKPTSKARDHFMLKKDRPPHVTILCLVRDAAARLPGSIGTRADVCTLIRDSQFIVEDVSDAQVNQVVSGALDRLHYERDPCVQFDGDRKLWVYLHREREEEDFEDDGTSSTKKWKRQKKDPAEQPEQPEQPEQAAVAEEPGFDLGSDLNVEPPVTDEEKRTEFVNYDGKQTVDENGGTSHVLEQGNIQQGDPMAWDTLSLNPMRENKLLCQENSTNEDFDDETLGRERAVGMLSASLL